MRSGRARARGSRPLAIGLLAPAALAFLVSLLAAGAHRPSRSDLIAYVHEGRDDRPRIWLVLADGTARTALLPLGRERRWNPRWSPDGRRLLVSTPAGLYVARLDARGAFPKAVGLRRVGRFAGGDGADWSPDGTRLTFADGARSRTCSDLYTGRADGTGLRRLSKTRACERQPAWSPDGKTIALQRDTADGYEIVLIDAGGRERRTLGKGTFPAWSPDGHSLAFLVEGGIKIVDPGTGREIQTLRPPHPYDEPENGLTWSPDGRRLAFGFHDPIETFPLTHLAVIAADGSNVERLTWPTTFPDREPDWRPRCTVYGTDRDDVLTGTPGDDLICGLRGDDRIRALEGNDTVLGGDGEDILIGGPGEDRLFGAGGRDRLDARDGSADLVDGGPGVDRARVDVGVDDVAAERVVR
ncbi:MAG TPA: hypothetical protein VNJ46_10000 [Gaiellaceae bacterium]|nr:hypothetical protein [Gaiellaceae bacterium]